MKECGRMIKLVGMGCLWMLIMPPTKANGWRTCNTEKESRCGRMEKLSIKEISSKARRTEKENSSGKMGLIMMEIL